MKNTLNTSDPRIEQARVFAIAAHAAVGQKRKYSDEPYHVHPIAVAAMVQTVPGHTVEMVMAALLHDVVEDTGVTIEIIEEVFGPVVARLVAGLTDVSKLEDGNREMRKTIDRNHTAEQEPDVKTVKLADLIDNADSIITNDIGFARKWMREKEMLLEVLKDGDPTLFNICSDIVKNFNNVSD